MRTDGVMGKQTDRHGEAVIFRNFVNPPRKVFSRYYYLHPQLSLRINL